MPHINLQLGTEIKDECSPSIRCVVDTAAALCTGKYHFFAAIAKRYPQCVAKIYLPEDYSPIILSRIVQNQADAITTDLPVAFQFHLPYFTKDGSATSFLVTTGPHVSVNTVLGLPLITATGMIIDFVDEVVEAKNLDCPPFKIVFTVQQKQSLQLRARFPPLTTSNSRMFSAFCGKPTPSLQGCATASHRNRAKGPTHPCASTRGLVSTQISSPRSAIWTWWPYHFSPSTAPWVRVGFHHHRQTIHAQRITTKFLGKTDTCKFHMRPDQAAWNSEILGAASVCCPLQYLRDNTSWRG
jgi:hypothetical protein